MLPHCCSHPFRLRGFPSLDNEGKSAKHRIKSLVAAAYDSCAGQANATIFMIVIVEHVKVATRRQQQDGGPAGNLVVDRLIRGAS